MNTEMLLRKVLTKVGTSVYLHIDSPSSDHRTVACLELSDCEANDLCDALRLGSERVYNLKVTVETVGP